MQISLGGFVKLLILLFRDNDIIFSVHDQKQWHCLFYCLKKMPQIVGKPDFFENLRFDWDGIYPESQELSEFLHALCLVGWTNPYDDRYTLLPEIAELWSQEFKALEKETRQFLNTALVVAKNEFGRRG